MDYFEDLSMLPVLVSLRTSANKGIIALCHRHHGDVIASAGMGSS